MADVYFPASVGATIANDPEVALGSTNTAVSNPGVEIGGTGVPVDAGDDGDNNLVTNGQVPLFGDS